MRKTSLLGLRLALEGRVGTSDKHGIYDVFISYAGADFIRYIDQLVARLHAAGLSVWLDRTEIVWGDTIVGRVNEGLRLSRFVLVCLSQNFLARSWPEAELNAVLNIQSSDGRKRILPLILNSRSEVFRHYPLLAGLVTRDYDAGLDTLTTELMALVGVDVERDTIDVTVESAYTSTSVVLRPNLRDTLERLATPSFVGTHRNDGTVPSGDGSASSYVAGSLVAAMNFGSSDRRWR